MPEGGISKQTDSETEKIVAKLFSMKTSFQRQETEHQFLPTEIEVLIVYFSYSQ